MFVFIRKTYKIFLVLVLVVIFFFCYNTFLVDHSLVNLKMALSEASEAKTIEDFQKLKPLLKLPLVKEITNTAVSPRELLSIELVKDIVDSPKDKDQIKDVQFYLNSVIKAKEEQRGAVLSFLDDLNSRLFKPVHSQPKKKLESRVNALLAKINSTKDPRILQETYLELGNIYIELTDLEAAKKAFLSVIEIDQNSNFAVKAQFNLAWVYKNTGAQDKAIEIFNKLSKELSEKNTELALTSQYQVADAFYKKGDIVQARDKYAQLAMNSPKFAAADFAMLEAGTISLYDLKDINAAIRYLQGAVISQEERVTDKEAAVKDIGPIKGVETAMDLVKTTEVKQEVKDKIIPVFAKDYRDKGFAMIKQKIYREAINEFRKAIDISPDDSIAYSGISLAFSLLGQKEDGLDYANKAIKVKKPEVAGIVNVLCAYLNMNYPEKAIELANRELAKNPSDRSEFYYNLAHAYMMQGNVREAVVQFEKSIKLKFDYAPVYNDLGCAYWALKQYPQAIQKLKEAISIDPNYVDAHFNLGAVYFNLERYDEAYRELETALQIDNSYEQARTLLDHISEILKYRP